jgi:formamidopyrimidine-DNA glycosylase
VPELPEVDSARAVLARSALNREIADIDDSDTYECRPHAPGEIRNALVGRRLTDAHRRGKAIWCETSSVRGDSTPGPILGIHLGMSGRIFVSTDDGEDEGGDYIGTSRSGTTTPKPNWDRFTITFDDGGTARLFDKRRLGRVRLDPDIDALGPDAGEIPVAEFRERLGRGTAPIKARLLDQAVIAGIGNLLADEMLWQAGISPRSPSGAVQNDSLTTLHREMRKSIRHAIREGGVHTGEVIPFRHADAHCPPVRRPDAPRHRRRPHDLVVLTRASLTVVHRAPKSVGPFSYVSAMPGLDDTIRSFARDVTDILDELTAFERKVGEADVWTALEALDVTDPPEGLRLVPALIIGCEGELCPGGYRRPEQFPGGPARLRKLAILRFMAFLRSLIDGLKTGLEEKVAYQRPDPAPPLDTGDDSPGRTRILSVPSHSFLASQEEESGAAGNH